MSKIYTMHELLKTLQRITLVRDANGGRCRLLNVTEKDRKLVACLGFEGLFDDAEEVNNLLSARRLSMHLSELPEKIPLMPSQCRVAAQVGEPDASPYRPRKVISSS